MFKTGRFTKSMNLFLSGSRVEEVENFKYLGIFLSYNLRISKDIERGNTSFLRQFYGFFSKFSNANLSLKLSLFCTYCTSFYGSPLWTNYTGASKTYRAIKISYHKAVKKLIGVPYWYGNHDTCNSINFKTFQNLVNINIISFILQLRKSTSPCIRYMKQYLLFDSRLIYEANTVVFDAYGFTDILSNDFQAMLACIYRNQFSYESHIPYDQILNRQ